MRRSAVAAPSDRRTARGMDLLPAVVEASATIKDRPADPVDEEVAVTPVPSDRQPSPTPGAASPRRPAALLASGGANAWVTHRPPLWNLDGACGSVPAGRRPHPQSTTQPLDGAVFCRGHRSVKGLTPTVTAKREPATATATGQALCREVPVRRVRRRPPHEPPTSAPAPSRRGRHALLDRRRRRPHQCSVLMCADRSAMPPRGHRALDG